MDDDQDVFAAMGIAGFGQASKKRQLDPNRFDKNKRADEGHDDLRPPQPGPSRATPITKGPAAFAPTPAADDDDDSDSGFEDDGEDDELPAVVPTPDAPLEPEYDPSQEFPSDGPAPQFPITHEMVLKDHTKVISALTLDPSGARIVSGSHDYDCKLWDFGGMGASCKPFKTWEPAGSYHVCCRHYLSVFWLTLGW